MSLNILSSHFDAAKVGSVFRVDYAGLAQKAIDDAAKFNIAPAEADHKRTTLVLIDVQNTFCTPGFELFVGGQSGNAAVEDNIRLCRFIYNNLGTISEITATLDTHRSAQVFHPLFFVGSNGQHPAPYSDIHHHDLTSGKWRFNPALASRLGISAQFGQDQVLDYTKKLEAKGKYALTIWPYHAMLGGIGHALSSSVEEAAFYHSMLRGANFDLRIKGENSFTENYSALSPEVVQGLNNTTLGVEDDAIFTQLRRSDRMVIAGQAKSHCVAWTVEDLLLQINHADKELAKKVYLLEDCTSPVVVPGVVDHSAAADTAFERFASAGMHIVRSTTPMEEWD